MLSECVKQSLVWGLFRSNFMTEREGRRLFKTTNWFITVGLEAICAYTSCAHDSSHKVLLTASFFSYHVYVTASGDSNLNANPVRKYFCFMFLCPWIRLIVLFKHHSPFTCLFWIIISNGFICDWRWSPQVSNDWLTTCRYFILYDIGIILHRDLLRLRLRVSIVFFHWIRCNSNEWFTDSTWLKLIYCAQLINIF